ncbi:sensor histidine kinase [Cohnella sp. GCM10027633]|uniref:sensor histidine kinase n=1 Tax=unclassified Cohnella TaxID=2636738 RepID=UPI00363F8213
MERVRRPRLGFGATWRNPSVRRFTWTMLAFAAAVCLLAAIFSHYATERVKRQWLAQEYAIAGSLSQSDPKSAERWLQALAEPPTPETVETGRKWLAEYGVTSRIESRWLPALGNFGSWSLSLLLGGSLLLIALLAWRLFRDSNRQLKTLRELSVSLDNTVKHNVPMAKRIYGEGEIGLLANGVQELSLRLRETIEQLHRDKDFLKDTVADISHQLKTPLASLIIYVDLLGNGKTDPAHAAEFLATCKRELDRMEWLILTLLKLARIEADALDLHIAPGPFADTVRSSLASVRRLADDRGVSLVLAEQEAGAGGQPVLPHDTHWLSEAIANVLKNAIEVSPSGSAVTVSWERTPIFVRLRIADRGPGISEQHLPHIFKKFYRTTSGGSGVGLGLPLAKSIVEKHGGVLSAGNDPDGGAVFFLTIPLQPLPLASTEPASLTTL